MRQVIMDAPRHESIVTRNDDSSRGVAYSRLRSDRVSFPHRMTRHLVAPLRFATALVAIFPSDAPVSRDEAHRQPIILRIIPSIRAKRDSKR